DLNQRRPARSSIVERFGCRRRLPMFGSVFLVSPGFFFRALGRPLPISAEFIVDQMEGRELCPFCAGKLLHYLLHIFLIHSFAEIGLHVQPIAAGLKDDDFATALYIGQFRGTRVGGEIKITDANQPATFGSKSCRSQEKKDQQKVFRFHERISASIFGSIFPPLITATLIEVCGSSLR